MTLKYFYWNYSLWSSGSDEDFESAVDNLNKCQTQEDP